MRNAPRPFTDTRVHRPNLAKYARTLPRHALRCYRRRRAVSNSQKPRTRTYSSFMNSRGPTPSTRPLPRTPRLRSLTHLGLGHHVPTTRDVDIDHRTQLALGPEMPTTLDNTRQQVSALCPRGTSARRRRRSLVAKGRRLDAHSSALPSSSGTGRVAGAAPCLLVLLLALALVTRGFGAILGEVPRLAAIEAAHLRLFVLAWTLVVVDLLL